jgi:preprotein translocase subunit SecE
VRTVTETREPATPERDGGDQRSTKKKKQKVKKTPRRARIALFLRQMVAELRKVIWPTRRELVTYTIVVVIFVAVMMVIIGVEDILFTKAVFNVFG